MIIELKNGMQFLLSNYEDCTDYISLSIPTCVTQSVLTEFTGENLETVFIKDDKFNPISAYKNLTLDNDIGYSLQFNQTSFNLSKYHLTDRLNSMEAECKKIPNLTEQLTQAQADIAYISVLSDIDTTTTEKETSNESSI